MAEGRAVGLERYLEEAGADVLDYVADLVPDGRHSAGLYDLVLEYPRRGGKSLRPALCLATCAAFGGRPADALPSAVAMELYHNAFLAHDDVEDGSLLRRREPTLHQKYGVPIAINVGDATLALAMAPLLENLEVVGVGRGLRIIELIQKMAMASAQGQMMELAWTRDAAHANPGTREYVRMVFQKTCWYSFIAPMLIGALAAGAEDRTLARLARFATHLGIAFQIVDDLLNLTASESAYGKESAGDLWEGKFTLMLIHALRSASPEDRARALAILARPRPAHEGGDPLATRLRTEAAALGIAGPDIATLVERVAGEPAAKTSADVAFLAELIEQTDGRGHAERIADAHAARARRSWGALARQLPETTHRGFIEALVSYVRNRGT